MNSYNGFPPALRSESDVWWKKEIAAGRRVKPHKCCLCGQEQGIFDGHSEDYSKPFGDHIGKYVLCFPCHMMLHCRARSPEKWAAYKVAVQDGYRTKPYFSRDWDRFVMEILKAGQLTALKFIGMGDYACINPNRDILNLE